MSMFRLDEKLIAFVTARMEQLEGQQLNFGINNTRITVDFLTTTLSKDGTFHLTAAEIQAILDLQMLKGEVIEVEPGVYRSRIAETARCIRLVRQRFFDRNNRPKKILASMELVDAIRTEFRQRTRPNRKQVTVDQLLEPGQAKLDSDI